jgi:hypothetical protein
MSMFGGYVCGMRYWCILPCDVLWGHVSSNKTGDGIQMFAYDIDKLMEDDHEVKNQGYTSTSLKVGVFDVQWIRGTKLKHPKMPCLFFSERRFHFEHPHPQLSHSTVCFL